MFQAHEGNEVYGTWKDLSSCLQGNSLHQKGGICRRGRGIMENESMVSGNVKAEGGWRWHAKSYYADKTHNPPLPITALSRNGSQSPTQQQPVMNTYIYK